MMESAVNRRTMMNANENSTNPGEEKITEAMAEVQSLRSVNKQLVAVSSVYNNATDMLLPAPSAIYLGAKLILLSNNCDFNIQLRRDTLLPYPSFRSSLIHVVHQLQQSFLLADDNMAIIQTRTGEMPRQFKDMLKWINAEVQPGEKEAFIRLQLKKLSQSALACEQVATKVANQFDRVTQLTEEMIEATVQQQKLTEDELKQLELKKKAKQTIDEEAKRQKAQADQLLKSLETEVSSAQQLFKTAITSSDRMVYAAMAAASATEVIKTAVGSVLPAVVAKKLVNFHGGQTSVNSHSTGDDSFEIITEEETRTNDRKSASILALTKAITLAQESVKLLNFVGEDEKTLCDCAVFESHADVGCKEIFKEIKRQLAQHQNTGSKKVQTGMDLAAEGWTVCCDIDAYRKEPNPNKAAAILSKIQSLHKGCQKFSALANKRGISSQNPMGQSLGTSKTCKPRKLVSKHQVQAVLEHNHIQIRSTLEYLKLQQSRLDKISAHRDQLAQEFLQRTLELQQIDISTADYKQIRKCLSEGLSVLSDLRSQWLRLVSFTHLMSQLISQSLCINISSLDESVTQLCDFESRGPLSVSGRSLQLETIHAEAVTAVQVSMITKHLAGGYLGVSRKFLMPQVRQLDSLLVAENPTLADLEISQAIKEASDGIHVEMENSKRDCAKELSDRMSQLAIAGSRLSYVDPEKLDSATTNNEESDGDFSV